MTGWWLGTFFHILGIIIPTDFHMFKRARPNHQPDDSCAIFNSYLTNYQMVTSGETQVEVFDPTVFTDRTTRFPTHRRPYGFRSFSSTKMSFSLQRNRNVFFSHVDVKNRVLKIGKTTSFFDISSCFFGMQHFFSLSQKRFIALTALQSSSRNR